MKVLISADSSCLIKNQAFTNYNIKIFPLNVIIDGKEYLDGVTINQEMLSSCMRANKNIKTSTPPLGEVIDYFENIFNEGYDYVIHFTISSKLSSMFNLFTNVAKQHFDGKVTVIDSYSLSAAMLNNVLYAYEEVEKGTSIDDIVNAIEERKKHMDFFFVPENLTALKNGGRISPAVALIGNAIGIKPVIALKDGELIKEEMTRKTKKTFVDRAIALIQRFPVADYDYTVISFDVAAEKLDRIMNALNEVVDKSIIINAIIPINAAAHSGPGTIGLIVSPKINGKSLNDYK